MFLIKSAVQEICSHSEGGVKCARRAISAMTAPHSTLCSARSLLFRAIAAVEPWTGLWESPEKPRAAASPGQFADHRNESQIRSTEYHWKTSLNVEAYWAKWTLLGIRDAKRETPRHLWSLNTDIETDSLSLKPFLFTSTLLCFKKHTILFYIFM